MDELQVKLDSVIAASGELWTARQNATAANAALAMAQAKASEADGAASAAHDQLDSRINELQTALEALRAA